MPDYYICAGVRRALVARELGRADIEARIIEIGRPDRLGRLPLTCLFSPKAIVLRDWRYLRVLRAVLAGRMLDPIDAELLGSPLQPAAVPLTAVILQ